MQARQFETFRRWLARQAAGQGGEQVALLRQLLFEDGKRALGWASAAS